MQKIKAPSHLLKLQSWFSKVITRPIDEESRCQERAPSGALLEEEASLHIKKSPTLKPHERVNLYNQQYCWRLLKALQDNFPFLLRLFGYREFNSLIAMPYLTATGVHHWSLASLGKTLFAYLEKNYHEPDREIVLHAAELDAAYCSGFIAKENPLPTAKTTEKTTLFLQPHLFIKRYPYQLLPFRDAMLKEEVEIWMEKSFPELKKEPQTILLFRNEQNFMEWQTLPEDQAALLEKFQKGASLEEACRSLPDSTATQVAAWFTRFGEAKLFSIR